MSNPKSRIPHSWDVGLTVCVICRNHLTTLLTEVPQDSLLLMGYVDDNGDVQSLGSEAISQAMRQVTLDVIGSDEPLDTAHAATVVRNNNLRRSQRAKLEQLMEDK